MTTPTLDLLAPFRCTRKVGADEHPCAKPGVTVADGPCGVRVVLCADCERIARRAVNDPRYANDWTVNRVA